MADERSRLSPGLFVGSSLLTAGLLMYACGTPAGVDPDACEGNVRLSVSAGLTPNVSWNPDCTVGSLRIDSAPSAPPGVRAEVHPVWLLSSPLSDKGARTNLISSPVTWSSVPPGVTVEVQPRPLIPGVHYRVTVVSHPLRYPTDGHLEINALDFVPEE